MKKYNGYDSFGNRIRRPLGAASETDTPPTDKSQVENETKTNEETGAESPILDVYMDMLDKASTCVTDNDEQGLIDEVKNIIEQAATDFGAENIIPSPIWDEIASLTSDVAEEVASDTISSAVSEAVGKATGTEKDTEEKTKEQQAAARRNRINASLRRLAAKRRAAVR